MILAVELQCQFPVGDVPPSAVERGGVLSALALAEDKVAVGGTAESGGAGNHVHGIIVIHLPQMMHQQNGDAVLVRQRFQNADVPVVAGIGIRVIAHGADALERVDMVDFRHRQIGELSGGQKKRVFLARAIAQQGDVILLDEPFTGVDVKTEAKIISLLRELRAEGKTMLVSTHNLGSVTTFCDYTVMVKGTVLASGPTDTTFTAENLELAFSGVLRHVTLNGSEESIITDDEHPFVAHRPSAVQGEAR